MIHRFAVRSNATNKTIAILREMWSSHTNVTLRATEHNFYPSNSSEYQHSLDFELKSSRSLQVKRNQSEEYCFSSKSENSSL
jgi:hypothetical protein